MKKTTWKKIMSLVLAVALVIGAMQFNSRKVSAGVDSATATAAVGENSLEPTLTFNVEAEGDPDTQDNRKSTDVVLVVDLSGSMKDDGKLGQVKIAAKNFCDQLLTGKTGEVTRVAVASYGMTSQTIADLTDNDGLAYIKQRIEDMNVGTGNEAGTNIQAGIREAETILADSTAKNKIIVLLSDGKATFAYRTVTKTFLFWTWEEEEIFGDGTESQSNRTMNAIKEATKAEAQKAKNAGYEIITISYGNGADSALMTQLSSSNTTNVAGTNVIDGVLNKIGKVVISTIAAGTEATIVADLGDEIKKNGELPTGVSISPDGSKITWEIGTLDADKNSGAIPLKVDATIDALAKKYGVNNGVIDIPVSTNAVLTYKDKNGQTQTMDVNNTRTITITIPVVKYTVKYFAEQLDGSFTELTAFGYDEYTGTEGTVTAAVKTASDLGLSSDYANPDCSVAAENNVISVKAYLKTATVTYNAKNENGVYVVIDTIKDVKYGTEITVGGYEIASYSTYEPVASETVSGQAVSVDKETVHNFNNTWKLNNGTVDEGSKVTVKGESAFYALYGDDPVVVTNKVTFIVDDEVYYETPELEIGADFKQPEDPEKKHYDFAYWSLKKDGDKAGVVSVIPTDDVTYYAVFTPAVYEVTYYIDGKRFEGDPQRFYYGDDFEPATVYTKAAELAAANKSSDAYTVRFTGWATTENIVDGKVCGNADATAQFSEPVPNYVSITYLYEDGKQFTKTENILKGSTEVSIPDGPEKKADEDYKYTFDGWYDAQDNKLESLIANGVQKDITVQAKYTAIEIQKGQFNFYKFEETVAPNEVFKEVPFTEDTVASIAAPADPEKADYTFRGWVTFITYADMLERTKEKVVVSDDVDREVQFSAVNAPKAAAGTKTEDGEWITFAKYMEEYFAIENRDFFPTYSKNDSVITPPINIIIPIITETPEEPTPTPTAEPTAEPTPEPTAEPTPEPVVDIEETETPEGDVVEDLEPIDTPQSAPEEEELDVEPIDTPQGDLPKTGVAPSAVFFGIGAACVVFGGAIVLKLRRKEEM